MLNPSQPCVCQAPRCRRLATVTFRGQDLCDAHFSKIVDREEEEWIQARSERHEDPALGIDGAEVVVGSDH